MPSCTLTNLGTCLVQNLFEFILAILNAPIQPFLQMTLNLLSSQVNLNLFFTMWVIVIYVLSMFYSLLLMGTGFNFMISGYDSEKRDNAKQWLRNIVIMIVLIQASFFIYQLAIDLSAIITSTTLTLVDPNFFLVGTGGIVDLGIGIVLVFTYLITLLLTSLILVIRYAFVAVGVVLFPIAIFFYFMPPLKQYGSLIMNFLGISIFVTVLDSIILAGFGKLTTVGAIHNFQVILLISAFLLINIFMFFLLFFAIIKSGTKVYSVLKKVKP